jgi:hypothetical protein
METSSCPFQVECQFHNGSMRTPSDAVLQQLFCHARYDTCEIAQRMIADMPVPAGARPDGIARG